MQQESSTKRRIDFGMFERLPVPTVGGGVLSADQFVVISHKEKMMEVLKMIDKDSTVYWVSDGAWSMHELLLGLLNITGAADVYISSYAMGETPARVLAKLKSDGIIRSLYCVLDNRVDVRTAGSLQLIKSIADKYALIDTHAKVTVITNEEYNIAVIGSANYTENERYEAGVICMQKDVVDLHLKWIKKEVDGNNQ